MKPPDIIEITLKVVKVFKKLNIAYYIGGSLASSAFGVARSTLDVDIVADIKIEQASIIEELFKEEFYAEIEMKCPKFQFENPSCGDSDSGFYRNYGKQILPSE